jgi:hypothetical protein
LSLGKASLTPFGVLKRPSKAPRISFGAIHVEALSGFYTYFKDVGNEQGLKPLEGYLHYS